MVTLLAATAALDNSTVVRLEAWLEQRSLELEARALASRTQAAATAGANEPPATTTDAIGTCAVATRAVKSASRGATGREETEGQAPPPAAMHTHATMIQSQVRCGAYTSLRWFQL